MTRAEALEANSAMRAAAARPPIDFRTSDLIGAPYQDPCEPWEPWLPCEPCEPWEP